MYKLKKFTLLGRDPRRNLAPLGASQGEVRNKERILAVEESPPFKGGVLQLLVFFYFLTLSIDLLNIPIIIYKAKITHAMAAFLFCFFLARYKTIRFTSVLLRPALAILCSLLISAILSVHPLRCFGYVNVYLFNFICYFILPYNLFMMMGHEKILRLYFLSFVCMGIYATLQVGFSFFGIYDPFALQRVGFVVARGQALTYEPSFYALYMTAFVMFYNARIIFQKNEHIKIWKLVLINLFLLVSTSTGVFFTYPIFSFLCLIFSSIPFIRAYTEKVKRKTLLFMASFVSIFGVIAICFTEIFVKSFYKFFYFGFMSHGSFADRFERMIQCWNIFLENFWFGVGLGGISPYIYLSKYNSGNFPEGLAEVEIYEPTNVLTELLGSLGFFGVCAFAWLAYSFYRLFKEAVTNPVLPANQRMTAVALFLSLVTVAIVLQFNQGLFRHYIWVHAAITVAFLRACSMYCQEKNFSLQEGTGQKRKKWWSPMRGRL